MSILYAISIVYIAGEYDGPGFCTPIGISDREISKGIGNVLSPSFITVYYRN